MREQGVFPTLNVQDLCSHIIDYRGKTPVKAESGVRLITAKVVKAGEIQPEPAEFIPAEIYDSWMTRGLPRQWDVLITTEAPLGETAIIRTTERFALGQRLILLRTDPRKMDQRFLLFALQSATVRAALEARATGTTVRGIKQSELRQVLIPTPPLPIQRRIASILGAYDDLIEVNRRRIAVLEEMARRLFDEWFVHFRFPGHEGHRMVESEHGRLPEGWRRVPIKEAYDGLFDGPHATPPPADQGPVFLGIGNVTETGRLDLSSVRHIAEADYERWTKRVTPSEGDIVFTYEATLNRYALIPRGFRGCLGRRLALIRANAATGRSLFLYLYFFTLDWRATITRNTLSGATVDRIPLTRFPDFQITLPPDALIDRFNSAAQPMFAQMHAIEQISANAQSQRDLLLPRLISGELCVSNTAAGLDIAA